jgi:hypothetical protein
VYTPRPPVIRFDRLRWLVPPFMRSGQGIAAQGGSGAIPAVRRVPVAWHLDSVFTQDGLCALRSCLPRS